MLVTYAVACVLLGIPHPLRSVVWPLLLGADQRQAELPLHYRALVELGGETKVMCVLLVLLVVVLWLLLLMCCYMIVVLMQVIELIHGS